MDSLKAVNARALTTRVRPDLVAVRTCVHGRCGIESWREFFQSRVDVNPRLAMAAVIDDDVACATDCCFAYCNRQWEYCTLLLGFIDLQGTSFHSTGGSAQLFRARRRGAATV